MKNFSQAQVKFFKLIILFIAASPLVLVVMDMRRAYSANSALGVAANGFMLLMALYLFGTVASLLYSGNIATGIIDLIFYPRHYLKAPPVMTSRQQGLIATQKFQLAEKELFELREKHPSSPEVAQLLAELHAGAFKSPETAIADILFYRRKRRLRYHQLNLHLSMRCADFYVENNQLPEAVDFLTGELSVPFICTKREREVMQKRIAALQQQLN